MGLGIEVDLRVPRLCKADPPELPERPLGAEGPTVFVSTYYSTPSAMADASVVLVHDTIYEDEPEMARADPDPTVLVTKRRCIADAAVVIVPSEATASRVQAHYPGARSKLRVVPEGTAPCFNDRPHYVADEQMHMLLAQHSVERPYLLHVGGRAGYKNFGTVLSAYVDHGLAAADYDLVAVGSETGALPSEAGVLRRLDRGIVAFPGQVDRRVLASLYRAATGVVSASRAEGFGLPVVEALASGAAVACSQISAHEETAGSYATFFPARDARACAEAIRSAARAPLLKRQRMAAAIRSRYDWDKTAQSIGAIVEELPTARGQP